MFNGIIECLGTVERMEQSTSSKASEVGKTLTLRHSLEESGLKVGDSIAINGVCTTVLSFTPNVFTCFASKETLSITNLSQLEKNSLVNLERSMAYQGRINGHLVYGHIDQTAKLINLTTSDESNLFEFEITKGREYLIPKGSIAINGISLTVYRLTDTSVEVMIIPHTYTNTNLHLLKVGDSINIEFDALGKYLKQYFDHYKKSLD